MTLKRVAVEWRDSRMFEGQTTADAVAKLGVCVIKTCGYLVHEDANITVIARELLDDEIRGVVTIPRENIARISQLERLPKRKRQ